MVTGFIQILSFHPFISWVAEPSVNLSESLLYSETFLVKKSSNRYNKMEVYSNTGTSNLAFAGKVASNPNG